MVVISALALLLSLMSIYSVVDFTVSKRTREIGVRVALGASPQSLLSAIFRRPLIHIGSGIVAGAALVFATSSGMFGGLPTFGESLLIAAYVASCGAYACSPASCRRVGPCAFTPSKR